MIIIREHFPVWYKVLFFLWVIVLIITGIPDMIQRIGLPEKQYGTPLVITEYIDFEDTPISQIVDDGEYMYVLVDDHQGYVQVYTLDGEYLHTISFYDASNGSFSMAVEKDVLYVRDTERNIYIFRNGIFEEFIAQNHVVEKTQKIEFGKWSDRYEMRLGTVWRVDLQEPIVVIPCTISAIVHQYYLDWVIILCSFLILIILGNNIKRNKGTKGEEA